MAAAEWDPRDPGDLVKKRPSRPAPGAAPRISPGTCREMQHSGRMPWERSGAPEGGAAQGRLRPEQSLGMGLGPRSQSLPHLLPGDCLRVTPNEEWPPVPLG